MKALIALGGGPSPVINASLLGVFEGLKNHGGSTVLAALHGIEGVLCENLIDLSAEDAGELALLRHTPASGGIGSCRYKLCDEQTEDFDRIIEVLLAHEIDMFFYIGGNDSMDTAEKVSKLAHKQNYPLVVAGVPKTIDNDLGDDAFTLIDHTPGYGSAARYWANIIKCAEEENRGMCGSEPVAVLQAMGRKSGYITAAARLADPEREFPMQLYFAESGLTLDELTENVNTQLSRDGRCIVVVNEGFDISASHENRDGFGHVEYGASEITAAWAVVNHLNKSGILKRGNATGQIPGVLQRCTSLERSAADEREAYEIGAYAVEMAVKNGTGYAATILRRKDTAYAPYYDKVPLTALANNARVLPLDWITREKTDVTDDFIRYALPLIGDAPPVIPYENALPRFAKLRRVLIPKRCGEYRL